MRVVIVGAGALGSVVGGLLARAGNDVTMISRGERLQAIRERGLKITGLADFSANVNAVESATGLGAVDLVLLAVKTRDTVAALERVAGLTVGAVASLQNGVVKDDHLAAAFGSGKVIGASTIVGASNLGPGAAQYTMQGATFFGEISGGGSPRTEAIVGAFNAAGLPTNTAPDIRSAEWSKLCQVTPAMTISTVTRLEYHKVCLDPRLAEIFMRITHECAAVARACGVAVGDYPGFEIKSLTEAPFDTAVEMIKRRGAAMQERGQVHVRISMLQDVLAGRKTEIEETAGYVVANGQKYGVPVTTTETVYKLVKGIEAYLD